MYYLPRSLRYVRLRHKLINVVIVAIVYAVDVAQTPVPACPLTVAQTTFSEGCHPNTIGIQTVAEVEILCLYRMKSCTSTTCLPAATPSTQSSCSLIGVRVASS